MNWRRPFVACWELAGCVEPFHHACENIQLHEKRVIRGIGVESSAHWGENIQRHEKKDDQGGSYSFHGH